MSGACVDAVVIGGGFYGTVVGAYLTRRRGMKCVTLLEREGDLLMRASYANQARVHNGYHYPRSFTTAYRSRINLPRFVRDFPEAVRRDFTKVYAVAREGSKVTAAQFTRFCRTIGATLRPTPPAVRALFDRRLVEQSFLVEEFAFDAEALRARAWADLRAAGVETLTGVAVESLKRDAGHIRVGTVTAGSQGEIAARHVFNCTYSGLNRLRGDFTGTRTELKHEITELALVEVEALRGLGITVMDGPFFSVMPFPPRGLHSLSHVRYTPHRAWADARDIDPYAELERHARMSRVERMLRDAARYLPCVREAAWRGSLFEVKTVLRKNESDDGRPILFESHPELGSCYSILGGKIDNIYDVLERLDRLPLGAAEAVNAAI